jgi:hypothetical protein
VRPKAAAKAPKALRTVDLAGDVDTDERRLDGRVTLLNGTEIRLQNGNHAFLGNRAVPSHHSPPYVLKKAWRRDNLDAGPPPAPHDPRGGSNHAAPVPSCHCPIHMANIWHGLTGGG